MHILITNTVALNGGDAAILESLVKLLREHFGDDVRIVVFDSHPENASRYTPDLEFRLALYNRAHWAPKLLKGVLGSVNVARFKFGAKQLAAGREWLAREALTEQELRDLKMYRDADLIVSTGGTYLVEHYHLDHRILDFRISQQFDTPLAFFTQSLGPFEDPYNRRTFREIFNRAIVALLRDDRSRDHLIDIGVDDAHLHVVADGVFGLADKERLEAAKSRTFAAESPEVAVSVRYWHHFHGDNDQGMRSYKEAVADAVTHLVRNRNARVTFVSTCQGIEEYWTDDSIVAAEIVDMLPSDVASSVVLDRSFHPPDEMIELLAGMDLVIATRMHMAIIGLIAGTPVLPIAYEFKTQQLFERLGAGEWVADINEISGPTFTRLLERYIDAIEDLRAPLLDEVCAEVDSALSAGPLLREAYEKSGAAGSSR